MAKQLGIIKLTGSIGDVTFSKTQDGFVARAKPGVTRERVLNSPAYERTRENMSEFDLVSTRAALLREAVRSLSVRAHDRRMHRRLDKLLHAVKRGDTVSDRGKRNLGTAFELAENREMLRGFEFNAQSPLSRILCSAYEVDVVSGAISFAQLDVREELVFPAAATHVFVTGAWVAVDFKRNLWKISKSNEVILARNSPAQGVTLQPANVPLTGGDWVVVSLLRVGFSQVVNGVFYPLEDAGFNGLRIVGCW